MLSASDQDVMELAVVVRRTARSQVDDAAAVVGAAAQRPVEAGPALRIHLTAQRRGDVPLATRPKLERHQAFGLGAQSAADIIAADDQVRLVVGAPPHEDVDVRIVCVVMGHRHPVEARAKVSFRLGHQIAGEALQVAHLAGVLGRDDEAEMMPIGFAPGGEGAPVRIFALGVEQPSGGAVTARSVALQVAEVGRERRGAKPAAAMSRDASLDEDAAPGTAQRRPRSGQTAAPEGRAAPARSGEP